MLPAIRLGECRFWIVLVLISFDDLADRVVSIGMLGVSKEGMSMAMALFSLF